MQRDNAERENREKERKLDELREEVQLLRTTQTSDLMSSNDDVDNSVSVNCPTYCICIHVLHFDIND